MDSHNIYISHAWGGESEKIVQEIYKRSKKASLNIMMDRHDLGYRESISAFMQDLGRADAIIMIVSNKYLHSEYCMYELLQIYENKDIVKRIFPVVLDEVSIAKSTDRLDLVKYWENETDNLETKIRELKNLTYIEGITEDLNLYQKIRNNIANLTRILKDINTLNIKLHQENDYDQLFNSIHRYLKSTVIADNANQKEEVVFQQKPPVVVSEKSVLAGKTQSEVTAEDKTKKTWLSKFLRISPFFLILLMAAGLIYSWTNNRRTINGLSENSEKNQVEMIREDNTQPTSVSAPNEIADSDMTSKTERSSIVMSEIESPKPEKENKPSIPESKAKQNNVAVKLQEGKVVSPAVQKESIRFQPNENQTPTDETIASNAPEISKYITPLPKNDPSKKENSDVEPLSPSSNITVHLEDFSVNLVLGESLSSDQEGIEGKTVIFKVADPITKNGTIVIRKGAKALGKVTKVRSSLSGKRSFLEIQPVSVEAVNGVLLDLISPPLGMTGSSTKAIVFNEGMRINPSPRIRSTSITLKQ